MAKYKFTDDAVNPVLEELAKVGVKRNKIEYEQILKIQELLKINTYKTIDELRAVRNSVVKLFTERQDVQTSYDEAERYEWAMKGCLLVIDSRIWDMAGELE